MGKAYIEGTYKHGKVKKINVKSKNQMKSDCINGSTMKVLENPCFLVYLQINHLDRDLS